MSGQDAELVLPPEALPVARRVLTLEEPLCLECRGRSFGRLGHGLSNPERLQRVARAIDRPLASAPSASPCPLCHGSFARIPQWVERAIATTREIEWDSFLCGSRWDPTDLAREEALWTSTGSSWGESLKTAFNRELGKAIEAKTGKPGRQEGPDLVFLADIPVGAVEVTVSSLYFQGRYRKLDRTIPQTRWPCRRCRGKGCSSCGGTGKTYATSVEELIAGPLMAMSGGTEHRFHGMGREDIDARMLGRGRPFVAELLSPRKRHLDLPLALQRIHEGAGGSVEVEGLAPATSGDVVRVKEARWDKTYRVVVEGILEDEKIKEALSLLAGRELLQRTPLRVSHRRADLVRHRTVQEAKMVAQGEGTFTIEVRAEAGTYIKEFVEGDGGRTDPSLAAVLAQPLKVRSLDVLAIHDEEGGVLR